MNKVSISPKEKKVVAGIYTDEYYTKEEDIGYITLNQEPPLYKMLGPIQGDKFISGLYYRFINRKGEEETVSILAGEKVSKKEFDPEAQEDEFVVIPNFVNNHGNLKVADRSEMIDYYRKNGNPKSIGKKDIVVNDFSLLHFCDLMIRAKVDDLIKNGKDSRDFFEL